MRRKNITLLYKSGHRVHVRAESVTVRHRSGEIIHISWTNMIPQPLHIGVGELAAVFEGHV